MFGDAHRLYSCRRCGQQVVMCRSCDRGHVYCLDGCSGIRRQESLRRAGRRYQRTPAGRANHAMRQQRYAERRASKMTHQGSSTPGAQVTQCQPITTMPVAGPENDDETFDRDDVAEAVEHADPGDLARRRLPSGGAPDEPGGPEVADGAVGGAGLLAGEPCPRCHRCGAPSRWLRRAPLRWRTASRRHRPRPLRLGVGPPTGPASGSR